MKEKIIIYQALPRLFGADSKCCQANGTKQQNGCGKFLDFSTAALDSIRNLGCNYLWVTGILEHSTKTDYSEYGIPNDNPDLVKGNAGSPYAVKDYYNVDPDLAVKPSERLNEFGRLLKRAHHAGLKVLIDFVPNHVAAEYKGTVNTFNDENYYPFHYHDGDWTDTAKLNYNNRDTWKKMLDILLFWADKGIDGFRCDMAELVPCEFWEWAIPQVKNKSKVIFIAEIYNPQQYRNYIKNGHFDYLYDKVGLYDTLRTVICGGSASLITKCWQDVDDISGNMVNFLENHDEQRLASTFFAGEAKKGIPALLVSTMMRSNPFMLYFGQELGEAAKDAEGFSGKDGRTTIFDYWTIDKIARWRNKGKFNESCLQNSEKELRSFYGNVFKLCNTEKALQEGFFFDIMYANYENENMDTNKLFAFMRKKDNELILVVSNFSDSAQHADIIIPGHAFEYFGMQDYGQINSVNLLNGVREDKILSPKEKMHIDVSAWNGLVLKFIL